MRYLISAILPNTIFCISLITTIFTIEKAFISDFWYKIQRKDNKYKIYIAWAFTVCYNMLQVKNE